MGGVLPRGVLLNPDLHFLQTAVDLARENVLRGDGGPFGAVVVKEGKVIGQGWNQVISLSDPTAHAEIMAIRHACTSLQAFHLLDCTLYCSSEPCPMCLSAAYWARMQRIVFANPRQEARRIGFCDAFIYEQLAMSGESRSISCQHIPLEGAFEPLQLWLDNPARIAY